MTSLAEHGTPARYAARCGCQPCREANAAYMRSWRAARQAESADAPRWGESWTAEEDARLLEVGALRASMTLSRTYSACRNRLDVLRRSA